MPSLWKLPVDGNLDPAPESCWGIRGMTLDGEPPSAYTSIYGVV